jgi:hypothetical protein
MPFTAAIGLPPDLDGQILTPADRISRVAHARQVGIRGKNEAGRGAGSHEPLIVPDALRKARFRTEEKQDRD